MERKAYPSDISRKQFEAIRPMLEGAKRRTAPRRVDLYDVFCAILYLLKNGCTWRAIPGDFPNWHLVRYYFDHWTTTRTDGYSLLEQALKKSGQARAYQDERKGMTPARRCLASSAIWRSIATGCRMRSRSRQQR